MARGKRALENVGKGENAGYQHFSPFPAMFSAFFAFIFAFCCLPLHVL